MGKKIPPKKKILSPYLIWNGVPAVFRAKDSETAFLWARPRLLGSPQAW